MVNKERLKEIIMRLERLEKERGEIADDIRGLCADAKAENFDVRALRQIIRERRIGREKVEEQNEVIALYREMLYG